MKKWFLFLAVFFLTTLFGFAQIYEISQDSIVNRLELNTLNLRVESGAAGTAEYYNRGNLNAFFGDTTKALSDFNLVIQKDADFYLAYVSRGAIYLKQHKNELAEQDFNTAIKLDKYPKLALNNRGFLYRQWNKPELAIKDFERAIKIDSKFVLAYLNLADLYFFLGNSDKAFSVLDRLIAACGDDPKVYSTRSVIYRDAGKLRKALDDLNKAVELSGFDPDLLIERAQFKDDYISDDAGAVKDCDLAIQKNPNVADYYYQRSRPLYDLEEYTAVIENCEKTLELDPKHFRAMVMLANVMDMFNLSDDAEELYERAISTAPDDFDAYRQLTILEYTRGNKKQAMSLLETYMNRGNFNRDITEQHGKIAADLKQFDVAMKDFSELAERYPTDPRNYFLRGIVQDSLGNHEAACNDMVSADKLGLLEAHLYLREHCKSKLSAKMIQIEDMWIAANTLESQGRMEEALAAFTELIKVAPDSSAFYYNRGVVKRKLDDHLGAIEDYDIAIKMSPEKVEYIVSKAVSYTYLNRIDEAIIEYEKAIELTPSYSMSYYNLGSIYLKQKKYAEAIELFETGLYYRPNYTKAMMGLGEVYFEMNEMDKACEWYRKAEDAGDASAFGKRVRTCK